MNRENRHEQQSRLKWWRILIFVGVVAVFFYGLFSATLPKYTAASTPEEIAKADLSREYLCLTASIAEAYPGKLYGPEDFSEQPLTIGDGEAKFQTYRIVLPLKAGVTYGIRGQTATYAQRVYVNGELLSAVGTVSDRADGFTPKTDLYTIFFTPQSDETEIIVQHAWFNHAHGALHKIYLAQQQVITRMERSQTVCDGVIVGSLLAMAVFFFGMFWFNLSNRGMLWFSLSSLCAAVNYLIYESKQIMVFFPNLNWYVGHKIELLTNIYYFLFIALFAFATLKERPPKWLSIFSLSSVGVLSLYYIVAPSTFYSQYTVPIGGFVMVCELIVSVALLRLSIQKGIFRQTDKAFVSLAPTLTLIVYFIEATTYFSYIFYLRAYLMILLALCYALALTIGHTRIERSLSQTQLRELEIAEENAMLEKMNRLKSDFMRNLAHEMKTPLTVMSGYAQLTERQIQKNSVNEETVQNLDTIAKEAGRLSDMVTQLLDVTYQRTGEKSVTVLAPTELLEDAVAVCRPILMKNNNHMELLCQTKQKISANKEALLQVLINLCINSNKHTVDGVVTVSASDGTDGTVVFSVRDNGNGIHTEDLPYIFERGYSKDGGNGLGLTICREIIESAGGSISVESTGADGTTIRFTVPAEKEDI